MNPRILLIENLEQARQELSLLNCDEMGTAIMAPKAVFKTIKIEDISTKSANLLKQTFLAKGGEVAIARGAADLSISHTDVLICATVKQYRLALAQLKLQPWGLPQVAAEIESALYAAQTFPRRCYAWPGKQLSILPHQTLVMGILNLTPDSFSDGGKFNTADAALQHVQAMIDDGADIIDVGAESTRPYHGAESVSEEEEKERLLPLLEKVLSVSSVPVSVDTYKAGVAEASLQLGAHIINDIWGLQGDPRMAEVVAKYQVPVIIMHNQEGTTYKKNVLSHISSFLYRSIEIGQAAGIPFENFIIDPGIGFGKTPKQNLQVMSRLEELKAMGCPVLLGTSRKRFIGEVLHLPVGDRVEGTGATVALGITKGVNIVRVHDVREMARIAKMTDNMLRGSFDE